MATSTFGRHFTVAPNKFDEFIREVTEPAAPTLRKGFQSEYIRPDQDQDFWDDLRKVLSEKAG